MRIKRSIFSALPLCFLLFRGNSLQAQQEPSGNTAGFKLFFEKVYLHTDRSCYAAGDNIWFKAYLVNAQSNYPTNTSDNLYVELIDPDARIVSREVIRLYHGTGEGDFKLDDSIPGGSYRLRAYTNWMRNFGDHFIFERSLTVSPVVSSMRSPASSSPGSSATSSPHPPPASSPRSPATHPSLASSENGSPRTKPSFSGYDCQFLPEGGSLIEGLPGLVTFKAVDGKGRSVAVSGRLVSSGGDTVLSFQSSHLGMGSFSFTPAKGLRYKALLQYPGSPVFTKELSPAAPDGYTLSVREQDTALAIHIRSNIVTQQRSPHAKLTLAGRHGGKLYYAENISLPNGDTLLLLPKNYFPPGIACLTLYDESQRPWCERLSYIEHNDPVTITVSTDKKVYQPKEKVTLLVRATDAQGQPVKADLSLAVTDRGIINPDPGNILSYLELESELKGRIEDAAKYFDPANTRRQEEMDLLLRAQGWHSFLWRSMADTSIRISYLPEPGITISGRVRQTLLNKPLSNMNVTLYIPGAIGDKFRPAKTDSAGRYYLDGLEFYGRQDIKINSKNDKGVKGGWLSLDTLFKDPIAVDAFPFSRPDTTPVLPRYLAEAARRWTDEQKTPFHSTLPGVTVTNRTKTVTLRDGSAYTSFGYPEYDFTITPKDLVYETLANFLVHNIPGAVEDVEREGVEFIANGKPVRPKFIVDKKENVFERIDYYTVHMDQVNSVSVRHMVGPPTLNKRQAGAAGRIDQGFAPRDVFLVYLSLKPGAYNNDLSFINAEIRGYYEARSFYAPTHPAGEEASLPDLRTTLYWEPELSTDADGRATVTFYNTDAATSVGIDVEGLTEKGAPVTASGKYEVTRSK